MLTPATRGQGTTSEGCRALSSPGSLGKAQGLDGRDTPTSPKQITHLWYQEGKRPQASAEPDCCCHSPHPLFQFPDEETEAQKEVPQP